MKAAKPILIALLIGFFFLNRVEADGLSLRPFPADKSWLVYSVNPGSVIKDKIEIVNLFARPQRAIVYAVDAEVAADNSFLPKNKDDSPQKIGSWIKLGSRSFSLGAKKSKVIDVIIRVPSTVNSGYYAGALVVESSPEEKSAKLESNYTLNVVTRSALRVYVKVAGLSVPTLPEKEVWLPEEELIEELEAIPEAISEAISEKSKEKIKATKPAPFEAQESGPENQAVATEEKPKVTAGNLRVTFRPVKDWRPLLWEKLSNQPTIILLTLTFVAAILLLIILHLL